MNLRAHLTVSLMVWVVLAGFQLSFATKYYVANNGSNVFPGGTFNTPFRTINYAASKLVAGDTAFIRGGTYNERLFIEVSGTAIAPIVIIPYQQELPVIDGAGLTPAAWSCLVRLRGNHIHMAGFEVKNARWEHAKGVVLEGHHNRISNMNIHNIEENGAMAYGDYSIIENCRVWEAAMLNCRKASCGTSPYPNGGWASGISAGRDSGSGTTVGAVLRGNTAYNNWGEGLSTFEADGTLIEENTVYDNYATNAYISDARNVVFQRNLVYVTAETVFKKSVPVVFTLADELAAKPRSQNNTIRNNLFYGANVNLFSWTLVPGSGLTDVLFANNTLVNGKLSTGAINANSRISNNIVENASGVANVPTYSGLAFAYNFWSVSPPQNAAGTGDKIGNPGLGKTGLVTAGNLAADYFEILVTSQAINSASVLMEVAHDYFGTSRGQQPDIGAHEF